MNDTKHGNQMSDPIRIALTATGAPQASTLIRHLRRNGEHDVHLIALDMNADIIGKHQADEFYQIPEAGAEGYREAILDVVHKLKPDVILNCSENDLPELAFLKDEIEDLGTVVLSSQYEDINRLLNKRTLYETLADVDGIRIPVFKSPKNLDEFVEMAKEMGYPDKDLCFKPAVSKGSRGFRILSNRFDRKDLLLNHKPISRYMPLNEFVSIFKDASEFPDLLLMELAEGDEFDVMSVAHKGEALLTTVKSRESQRWGVIDRAELLDRADIRAMAEVVIREFNLSYNVLIQFIGGQLIEASNRTSSYIFQDDLCEPWESIKLGLGISTPDQVRARAKNIRYGRRMIRYMDQIFYDPDGSWED